MEPEAATNHPPLKKTRNPMTERFLNIGLIPA
jgi:hypothetical protein